MNRALIKEEAKGIVKGKLWEFWKPALAIYGICFIVGFIFAFVGAAKEEYASLVETIVSIAAMPASLGLLAYYMKIIRKQEYGLNELTKWYKYFGSVFFLFFTISLFTSLWALLFIIPGIIAAISYQMAPYIYIDGTHDALESIKKSKEMMKGYKADYFVFMLSFLGWILLGVLTLGILYIWLYPYMETAKILYYEKLKEIKSSN